MGLLLMNKIKYVAFFDFQDSQVQRNFVTSACNKIESICQILIGKGYSVEIISPSAVIEDKFKIYKGEVVKRNSNLKLKKFFSWGGKSKILNTFKIIWHLVSLFFYLLLKTKKEDKIIVYHSLGYYNIILWAKRLRKFKMILEVEEVYQDVDAPKYKFMAKNEFAMFRAANAFIFPTELLNKKINPLNKPYGIMYGTYTVEQQIIEKFKDGKIHVVYSGTFDPRKGGAKAAVESAEFLPENYHLHICGFGSSDEVENIIKLIHEISNKTDATISYDGLKKGKDYTELLQKCHIGLSTQNPTGDFNDTSFPSKILSYMANGLSVVSIKIPVLLNTEIENQITFYEVQEPKDIAKAIMKAPEKQDSRHIIMQLNNNFGVCITNLLHELN